MTDAPVLTVERDGHVLMMGLNRPQKRNAFNVELLQALGGAYHELDRDDDLRCGVLFAHGEHFTGGLDLAEVLPRMAEQSLQWQERELNPLATTGPLRTTPVVAAAHGWCMTIGIELLLAADIRLGASDARFAQLEVQRGIFPLGGATYRLPREAGWGNAMRWLLTGDQFNAEQALRLGLIQEITEPGELLDRAVSIAKRISAQAPLGVREIIASAYRALPEGEREAGARLRTDVLGLIDSEDGKEGMLSFLERRPAVFAGK
ncbi:MAG TPA: crotonase/enoyl-CoA hydratase family protein [Solirubrobacteraceae bacterium]|jgi:enoyl-CoA hydratase/carnithine racemase